MGLFCCFSSWSCYILAAGISYAAYIFIPKIILQRKLDRFNKSKCPKDVVILHGVPRSRTIPASSPFVLKLETFLRMADIPYEYDGKTINTFGPKGKTPWISLNGEHIADSQLCIEFLSKKGKTIKNNYSEKELATASLLRIMLEDRMFWELVMWAFVYDGEGPEAVYNFMRLPRLIIKYLRYNYTKLSWAQGMGRHSQEVVDAWTKTDMRSISKILGNNKFLLGDEPCVEDAAVFGFCAQMLWGFPASSPYGKLMREELTNVEAYCHRMKDRFFPDWEQLLRKPKPRT